MKHIALFLSILTSVVLSTQSFAKERKYRNRINTCSLTKPTINNYEPETFGKTNNLLSAPGAVEAYVGDKIFVTGTVLDSNCVPLSDAKVYIWQMGEDGKYPYKPLRTKVAHRSSMFNSNSTSSFLGSGTATTDNNGRFSFITIYPTHHNPEINIRVEHINLGTLQTKLLFGKSASGSCGCSEEVQNAYDFTIVMHAASKYKRF
jgi:protocatechuate 3,4-dioxygenase beta subunit